MIFKHFFTEKVRFQIQRCLGGRQILCKINHWETYEYFLVNFHFEVVKRLSGFNWVIEIASRYKWSLDLFYFFIFIIFVGISLFRLKYIPTVRVDAHLEPKY